MTFLATLAGLGLLGGCLTAVLISRFRIQRGSPTVDTSAAIQRPLSPDDINLSSIRVAGVGGLGMIAVCIIVALTMPAVGLPVAIGLGAGILMAVVLIRWRRRAGVLPSATNGPGAKTLLQGDVAVAERQGTARTDRKKDGLARVWSFAGSLAAMAWSNR